ncbi:MAG: PQQ-binding-like beta-propeller repeat protein [Lentisphaerae bacterium]|nr:PQQ-binding-like beta-propeller repeat protein [Lentisphaerota bacterium]
MKRWTQWVVLATGLMPLGMWGGTPDDRLPAGNYQVGYFNLAGEPAGENPARFVATLGGATGVQARLAGSAPGVSWRAVPADSEPAGWISLVRVRANRQCDFIAFHFSDREGTVDFASRRPSRIPLDPPKYPLTVPPGPDQIPANAVREPAGDFLYQDARDRPRERPMLRIEVRPVEALVGARELPPGGDVSTDVPAPVVEAMAFAAAFEAGWRPTAAEQADRTLHLSLTEELRAYHTARAVFADGTPGFTREAIPRDALYDHLVGLFLRLRQRASVIEAMPLGEPGCVLAGWLDGRAILRRGKAWRALSPASGRTLWNYEPGPRERPAYRLQRTSDGRPLVFRHDHGVHRIDLESGKLVALTPPEAGVEGSFYWMPEDALAVVDAGRLTLYRGGQAVWHWDGAARDARPVGDAERIYVAGTDGAVHALDLATGAPGWQTAATAATPARLSIAGPRVLVDDGRSLAGVDAAAGRRLWSLPTGDALLADPVEMEGRLLVAVAPNRLLLVDSASGASVASRTWPTWLLAVRAVKTPQGWSAACVDLRREFHLLDPSTLATLAEVSLPTPVAPVLAFGTDVPEAWVLDRPRDMGALDEDLVGSLFAATTRNRAAWLVTDQQGGVYAIAAGAAAK